MKTLNCEAVRMAASAAADGNPILEAAQLEDHLSLCVDCRREVERLGGLRQLLDSQKRRASTDQLWSRIEARLPAQPETITGSLRDLRVLVPASVVLVAYKLLEQLAAHNIGLLIKVAPLLLVVALFALLKENPFRINPGLQVKEN